MHRIIQVNLWTWISLDVLVRSFSNTIMSSNWISSFSLLSKHRHFYRCFFYEFHQDLRQSRYAEILFVIFLDRIRSSVSMERAEKKCFSLKCSSSFSLRFFEIFFLCWDFKEILNFIVIVLLQLLLQVFSLFFHYIDFYQTAHFFSGFIFEPKGQLKSLENSSMFERGPSTRNLPGLWKPVVIRSFIASGLYLLHQVFAALIQNNCWGL